jgi:hypothetical protein
MSQDLTVNIKTTSDVPQAMDKAKQATTEFAKQAEAVNKRFKDSVKDIILSTAGPMAGLAIITQRVQEYYEKIKQAQEDANKSAIEGVNERMSREDVYWARKTARENEDKKNKQDAARQPQTTAYEFLMNDPRAKSISTLMAGTSNQRIGPTDKTTKELMAERLSKDPSIQEKIRKIVAQDISQYGMIMSPAEKDAANKVAQAKATEDAKDLAELKQFAGRTKPGEVGGFGNVIGVGSNIAIEMAQMQIDELKRHTELLQMIATKESPAAVDFSKGDKSVAAPSRAKLLSGK